ncbi:hypothetical protein ACRALDRAFT_1061247 [Sodiomyces alcalophilus JCM 7366]|uniref:uncharacterized protein n=1 Tax=Sodiomyces alcalophilus JCM 7366 TaxID=591952 RepID=UPI0039B5122E
MTAIRRSARLSAAARTNIVPAHVSLLSQSDPEAPAPAPQSRRGRKRKITEAEDTSQESSASSRPHLAPPVTPIKRPTQGGAPAASTPSMPPETPTPSAASLIAEHANGTAKKRPRTAAVARLADPKFTNALLLSPETSRVVASKPTIRETGPESPSKPPGAGPTKPSLPTSTMTTATILEEACAHLIRVDPRMKPLVEKHHCRIFSPEGLAEKVDPFESLCSGIISQQVSGAAAKTIKAKFVALFDGAGGRFPHPSQVAGMPLERLRTAGLSQRKAEYIGGLAEKFLSGELSAQLLAEASYEEVVETLTAVRGLGRWSVEMFACFALKRMDVFSLGDLGVQRGMAAFMGRDIAKLKAKGGKWKYMSEKEMLEISERFAPYRSVFMWYMWRVEQTDISTLER